jgi:hypothetical protein
MTDRERPVEWSCGQSANCRDWDDHEFTEIYYGYKCKKCGLFYAFGCAPWEDNEP